MTRYYTEVADELLPTIRNPERMPTTLRLIREIEPGFGAHSTIVEFEDDEARAWLAGRIVTPTITSKRGHLEVTGRDVGPPYTNIRPA